MRKKNQPGCACCQSCRAIDSCLDTNGVEGFVTANRQILIEDLPTTLEATTNLSDCNSNTINCTGCEGPFPANVYVDHYETYTAISTSTTNPYTAACVHTYRDTASTPTVPCDTDNMIELCSWCVFGGGTTTAYMIYEIEIWPLPLQQPAPLTLSGVRVDMNMGYVLVDVSCSEIIKLATWRKEINFGSEWDDFCAGEDVEVPLFRYSATGGFWDSYLCSFPALPGPVTISLQPVA